MARVVKIDNADLKRRSYQSPKRRPRGFAPRILIVCEGEKTEPDYFRAFKGATKVHIEIYGEGKNTLSVVDSAIKYRKDAREPYDSVWAVFDRDSFPEDHFDNAINKAIAKGINCAWSNEAFEIWYLLHFQNRVTEMSREDYKKKISEAVNKKKGTKDYKYAKNDKNNHAIINEYGNQEDAIKWAKARHNEFKDKKYHTHNPCTLVYKLVEQLTGKDKDFNDMISAKYGEIE